MSATAVVVGAGVVGCASALALQRDGWSVTLLDRGRPGEGCSARNAGHLGTASVLPQATPQQIRALPRLLRSADGPLALRWSYVARNLPRFVRFVANARPARMEANARALAGLLANVPAAWNALAAEVGGSDLIDRRGLLHVWRNAEAHRASAWAYALRRRLGIPVDDLDAAAARALEPTLGEATHAARLLPQVSIVLDPLALTRRIVDRFAALGGRVLTASVSALERAGGRVERVRCADGEHPADLVVLAAGAWSEPLARAFGARVPLVAERGYSVTSTAPSGRPRVPLLLAEPRIAISPSSEGVRLATMAEFAAPDAEPDHERAATVLRRARELVPTLDPTGSLRWMGPRPSTPDSLPVIGRAPGAANLLFAYGHGHLGLTLAATTAEAIADLAAGRPSRTPLGACAPDRSVA